MSIKRYIILVSELAYPFVSSVGEVANMAVSMWDANGVRLYQPLFGPLIGMWARELRS